MAEATAVFAGVNLVTGLVSASKERGARRDEQSAAAGERLERKRLADVRAVRERRGVIREARIARAQSVASGVASGAGAGSSGPAGGEAGIASQLKANISFLDTVRDVESRINIFQEAGAGARSRQQKSRATAELGSTIFGSGGFAERLNQK